MSRKTLYIFIIVLIIGLGTANHANASTIPAGGWEAIACSQGECAGIPPELALAFILLSTFESNINANIKAAAREPDVIAKLVRGTTGISLIDIGRCGVLGGSRSEARKLWNGLMRITGGQKANCN